MPVYAQAVLDAFAAHPDYSVQQIADVVGCSRQTVWAIKQANVGVKAGRRDRVGAYSPEKEAYMVSLIRKQDGKSVSVIANLCGCALSTIYRLCKKYGIDRKPAAGKGGKPMLPATIAALDYIANHPDPQSINGHDLIRKFNLPSYGRDATKCVHWLRKKTGLPLPCPDPRHGKTSRLKTTRIGEL